MPFKETSEGQTHYVGDGCPEPHGNINVNLHAIRNGDPKKKIETTEQNIGMLRQWLNEDKIDDPYKNVTIEDIIKWLTLK